MCRKTIFSRRVTVPLCLFVFTSSAAAQFASFSENPLAVQVVSSSGTDHAIPFFGGFNNPVPQLIDIDNDGDLDLFVEETADDLQYYENIGSALSPEFQLKSRKWKGISIGAWFRFVDTDLDGDYDLLANQTFNAIRFYENSGTPEVAEFTLRADTLRSSDSGVITTELPNVPVAIDIDCNGDLDLLLGLNDGTITHFEQSGVNGELPVFDFVETNYQNIQVVGESGKTDKHGANALAVGDLSGDGIYDLLWGDFFELSLVTFLNASDNCATVNLVRTTDTLETINDGPFITRGFNVPTIGDLNNDGFNDIVAGVLSNSTVDDENTLYRFSSNAGSSWSLETKRMIDGIDVGTASVPAVADLNGDGSEDLIVANSISDDVSDGQLFYYRGGASGFEFQDSTLVDDDLGFSLSPDFGDLDDDGDPDLVVGRFDGTVAYLSNNGLSENPEFTLVSFDVLGTDVGSNAAPALVDLDGDFDLDLIVGESSGVLNYFENVGSLTSPLFSEVPGFFGSFDVGQNSAPAGYDSNQSGLYHLIVGSESEGLFYLENIGTPQSPEFESISPVLLEIPSKAAPAIYFGTSQFPDIIIGNVAGGLLYFENETIGDSTIPSEIRAPVQISIYPNPASSRVTVDLSEVSTGVPLMLAVVDLLGREQVLMKHAATASSSIDLDIGSLAPGVYLITLSRETKTIARGTLVVL